MTQTLLWYFEILSFEEAQRFHEAPQSMQTAHLQAELLRQCLACWSPDLHGQPDDSTFEKLSRFVERQNTFSWGRTIDIVQDAGFGDAFALRLCEELILRLTV